MNDCLETGEMLHVVPKGHSLTISCWVNGC